MSQCASAARPGPRAGCGQRRGTARRRGDDGGHAGRPADPAMRSTAVAPSGGRSPATSTKPGPAKCREPGRDGTRRQPLAEPVGRGAAGSSISRSSLEVGMPTLDVLEQERDPVARRRTTPRRPAHSGSVADQPERLDLAPEQHRAVGVQVAADRLDEGAGAVGGHDPRRAARATCRRSARVHDTTGEPSGLGHPGPDALGDRGVRRPHADGARSGHPSSRGARRASPRPPRPASAGRRGGRARSAAPARRPSGGSSRR